MAFVLPRLSLCMLYFNSVRTKIENIEKKKGLSKLLPSLPQLLRLGGNELFPEIEELGVHQVPGQSGVEVENEVAGVVLGPLGPFHVRLGIWCRITADRKRNSAK